MRRIELHLVPLLIGAAALLGASPKALACAACFGKSDSPLAQGMNMGILTLLSVIVGVLSVFACFFVFLARKSAKVNEGTEAPEPLIESQP